MSLKAAVPTYTCEYGDCENESRIQSPCCRKFYCSNEHSSSDIAGHAKENCPIFSVQQTNSGTKAVANFNLDKTQEKTVFEEEPVMMLPSVALQETCDEFICINCGLVIKSNSIDDSRCVLCQWPLCSGGCHFEFTENAVRNIKWNLFVRFAEGNDIILMMQASTDIHVFVLKMYFLDKLSHTDGMHIVTQGKTQKWT